MTTETQSLTYADINDMTERVRDFVQYELNLCLSKEEISRKFMQYMLDPLKYMSKLTESKSEIQYPKINIFNFNYCATKQCIDYIVVGKTALLSCILSKQTTQSLLLMSLIMRSMFNVFCWRSSFFFLISKSNSCFLSI